MNTPFDDVSLMDEDAAGLSDNKYIWLSQKWEDDGERIASDIWSDAYKAWRERLIIVQKANPQKMDFTNISEEPVNSSKMLLTPIKKPKSKVV